MRTISVKLPEDLLAELGKDARTRRVTRSSVMRESLEMALRARSTATADSCYDLARDLAGKHKGLPRDLARDPKYMNGFGE
jgi:predicted transcriptional regulator